MNEITWNKKKYHFPENWNELSKKQFLTISKLLGGLLFEEEVTEEDLYARRMIAFKKVMKIPLYRFKQIYSDEFVDLLKMFDFLKEIDLDKQIISSVKVGNIFNRQKLIGPKEGLKTSTFDEFILADTYFVNLSSKKDFDFAYLLFAIFYRPERKDLSEFKTSDEWNGDDREPFNTEKCKARIPFLKKYLPQEYLLATLYFYWGFRDKHLLGYTSLFPPKDPETPKTKKTTNAYGWADTRLEISGEKFGSYKETGQENWRNIIFEMHLNEEKRKRAEQHAKINRLKNQ